MMLTDNLDAISQKYTGFLESRDEILTGYNFGSTAAGKNNRLGDLDLAVYLLEEAIDESQYPDGYQSFLIQPVDKPAVIQSYRPGCSQNRATPLLTA